MKWPNNKDFAFTIIDDTDEATVHNVKPVYDYLYDQGIITTKTVWAFPSRDHFNGETLTDAHYRDFIKELSDKGYEIAFHGAGSGIFDRAETLRAMEMIKELVGYYPSLHINHASNNHNLYWGGKRFSFPINVLYAFTKRVFNMQSVESLGNEENSPCFWGDFAKKNIKYVRNRVYTGLNTLNYDKHMPYKEKIKEAYSNYWFSSADGANCRQFIDLVSPKNIDQLERQNGCAIVYTHFAYGFVDAAGVLDENFKKNMAYLAGKNAWFVPASTVLDYLKGDRNEDVYLNFMRSFSLDLRWSAERIVRKVLGRG